MKKKIFMAGMVMAFSVLLTGCHMKHEWQEATCTQPRTCIVGNETEGEALGHVWREADCITPKTCTVCGEKEGAALGHAWREADCSTPKTCTTCGEKEGTALGHTWQEADYFTPQTCLVCGETQGDPLQPSFEAHGLSINARVGETYDYVTCCSADESRITVGKLTFSNYREFDSAISGLEDYEWRAVHIEIAFSDENAQDYGMRVRFTHEDYYDTEAWNEVYDDDDNSKSYTIHFNGTDYTECKSIFSGPGFSGWVDGVNTWEAEVFVVVPIGYDGMVVCLRNGALIWDEGMYIYDVADADTIFFRMDDKAAGGASVVTPAAGTAAVTSSEDEPELLDKEQAVAAIKEILAEKCQGLVYDGEDSVMVSIGEDEIFIMARTYKDYLVPAIADRVVEAVYAVAKRSGFSLGTVLAYCADDTDDGEIDVQTLVSWETFDAETGTFVSVPDAIIEELYMIEDMYEYYGEYYELIEKAMNGERVDTE